MKEILYGVGVICILTGIITGIRSGSFIMFLICVLGGAIASVLYFALAMILENQDIISSRLHAIETTSADQNAFLGLDKKKTCEKCGKSVDDDRISCPYCGGRKFKDVE